MIGEIQSFDREWEDKLCRPFYADMNLIHGFKNEVIVIPYYAWVNRKLRGMAIWLLMSLDIRKAIT
jgi:hypothetical protein